MFTFKTKAETIRAEISSAISLLTNFEPVEPRSFASSLLVLVSVQAVRLEPEPGMARSFRYALLL